MQATDVRDVLGISGGASKEASSRSNQLANNSNGNNSNKGAPSRSRGPPTQTQARPARPEGITRELYALLGDNAPSLSLAASAGGGFGIGSSDLVGGGGGGGAKKFRPKFQRKLRPVRKWEWVPFKNPARKDDLTLYHWVQSTGEAASTSKPKKDSDKKVTIKAPTSDEDDGQHAPKLSEVGDDGGSNGDDVSMQVDTPQKKDADGSDGSDSDSDVQIVAESKSKGKGKEKETEVVEPEYATSKIMRPEKPAQSDYAFSQFNTTSGVYSYSNEEYHAYLKDDDWSKEETDYLIDLCHTYDLRFIVMHDRYTWPDKDRSIEDLKARYQTICRRLIRSRPSSDPPEMRSSLLLSYNFDRGREMERKRALKRLYARTPTQLAEEEALYVEARRLEQQEAKFAREREALLKLLGGWEAAPNWTPESLVGAGTGLSLAGLVAGPLPPSLAVGSANAAAAAAATAAAVAAVSAPGGDASNSKKKKRKFGADAEELLGLAPGSVSSAAEIQARQQAQEDERQGIMRFDPEQSPQPPKPPPHLVGTLSSYPPIAPSTSVTSSHGVYLRSTRTVTPRANLLPKTMESLAELQPTPIPQRLVFPTRSNIERWEGLIGALSAGLEMKRARERAESELVMYEARMAAALEREKERKKKAATTRGTANSLWAS
ncbi:hypothetical protein A4X09_0g1460 [Tilletia walkeri]|uniref:SWR1-complex protein 4 n=1 Tax=Tilletia walkeri TaxID=117179 RepID=A0A8X7T6M7_9BASI|nr:hypothetical protein A4X09_0g1460 [Tilletia walkeri]